MIASPPLRILFALPGLHRVNRGAEVVLEQIGRRAAADHGLDVTLVGSGPARLHEPYHYRRARCIPRESFEHFPRIPFARDHYAWEELTFAPGLARTYSPRKFDLTLTCGYPYTNWVLRARRGRRKHPPHVFVTQNGDWMVQARNWEFKYFGCEGLICTNPQYYERHKDRYRCALIPNGVDTAAFHPSAEPRPPNRPATVLIVSALIPAKRVTEAVRCVSRIPDVNLIVAGDGPQRSEVDALGQKLLGPRFRRLTLPASHMPDLYRSADVLLHMSQDEPFGNVYVEALATGLPIVAHDTPTTRWILEDRGHLVDTDDETAVAGSLRRAIEEGWADGSERRRDIALRRFSWGMVAKQYCDFFQDVYHHAGS